MAELSLINRASKNHVSASDGEKINKLIQMAFNVVVKAVTLLDTWLEVTGVESSIHDSGAAFDGSQGPSSAPLTPPADRYSSSAAAEGLELVTGSESTAKHRQSLTNDNVRATREDGESANNRYRRALPFHVRPGTVQSTHSGSMPDPVQAKRFSSYRTSSATQLPSSQRSPFVSQRLTLTHDRFLGCLGSFVGLHLPSRTSNEVFFTTREAVAACEAFLAVVDTVCERDPGRSEIPDTARDEMDIALSSLSKAARLIGQHTVDGQDIPSRDHEERLVHAATLCIRGAGVCVARTRFVLESIGDFEFEIPGTGTSAFDGVDFAQSKDVRSETQQSEQNTGTTSPMLVPPQPMYSPPPPPCQELFTPKLSTLNSNVSSTLGHQGFQGLEPGSNINTIHASLGSGGKSPATVSFSEDDSESQFPHVKDFRTDSGDASRTVSGSTLVELSFSTRATSPDLFSHNHGRRSVKQSFSDSHSTVDEDPEMEAKILEKTHAHELMFNKEGQIIGGSLPALIERLTADASTPDALFVSTFFLTFRLFVPPQNFAQALVDRFDSVSNLIHTGPAVRLRVVNVFKGWLESHWRVDSDFPALRIIKFFAAEALAAALPAAGKRLMDLALRVASSGGPLVPRLISSMGKTNTSITHYVALDTPIPSAVITKSQLALLRKWKYCGGSVSILDFDPLELARQLTIKASEIFSAILPEELLVTESVKPNVRAMSTLSTDLTNLVSECILELEDPSKRAKLIKRWVKIAGRCLELNNYDSLKAIMASVTSSTILRLKKTWDQVSSKTKVTLEKLNSIVSHAKNYTVLRQRLQNHVAPCLPFVGMYLTDLKFVHDGNPAERQLPGTGRGSEKATYVINFDKHMKTAKLISDLQRFQLRYRLQEVPELQVWIQDQLVNVRSSDDSACQKHYRMSLFLEPREGANQATKGHGKENDGSRDKIDLEKTTKGLSWKRKNRSSG